MARQLDQWEYVITTGTNDGSHYVEVPPSVQVDMEPSPIWAHAHLSTLFVLDDDKSFAGVYFTEYSYEDERGSVRTVNVDQPSNYYKKKVLISSWSMTSLTFEASSNSIGTRGMVIVELWQG